jgi:hypothetical protein
VSAGRPPLEALLDVARTAPPDELPRLLGDLEEIRATAMARLITPAVDLQRDELIDVHTAAQRLGVSGDYLYHHHGEYPFTRRQGRKLLFSSLGIDAYIREKNSNNVLTARQRKRILSLSASR